MKKEKPPRVYLGTVSFNLSDRAFGDFIRAGALSNHLPLLADAVSSLQRDLDAVPPKLLFYPGSGVSRRRAEGRPYFYFSLSEIRISSIAFEEGSVSARFQMVATIAFLGYQGLADYSSVKKGYQELKKDILEIVNRSFGIDGAGEVPLPDNPRESAQIRFYIPRAERFEDEVWASLKHEIGSSSLS